MKEPSIDRASKSIRVDAGSNKEVGPCGRIRRALKKPFDLLRKKKIDSTESTKSQPAIVESVTNKEGVPRSNNVRRTMHRLFPCLLKNKTESPEEQEISNKIDRIVNKFRDELKHYCADTDISPSQFLKIWKPLEPVVDKIARNLQKNILWAKEGG